MRGRILAVAAAAALSMAAPAKAAVIQDFSTVLSATNGIVLGPDGNFWVAEQFNGSVARMTPSGQVLNRYPVGAGPTSLATSSSGRVWVSVTGADQLVWFDALSTTPSMHPISTATASDCGPVAIVSGGDGKMYFSLPDAGDPDDPCAAPSRIAWINEETGAITPPVASGATFDLAFYGGKLYATNPFDDVVRRLTPSTLATEATIAVPGGPDGIAVDGGGTVWVTQYNFGQLARFPFTAANGASVQQLPPPAGNTLGEAFGLVVGADGVYATGKSNGKIARVSADGSYKFTDVGGQPWQIVNGPDGDLYFTDQQTTRVRRYVSTVPRVATGAATALSTSTATVAAAVDPRGNATQVIFDYGPTTAYGATAVANVPAGIGPAAAGAVLSGLVAGTTYHVRVRATNEEGPSAPGADTTFITPTPPPTTLPAEAHFSWRFIGSRTALKKVTVTKLLGGETIKVTCKSKSKGCPLKSKTYKNVKKGTRSLSSLFGTKRKLKTGAKIEIRITKAGAIGSSTVLTIGKKKKDPKIKRTRVKP